MGAFARLRAAEPALIPCAAIAAVLCTAMFLLQGRLGFNLQDEAFLWYGVIRTHAGDLPLRDFRAYDPGRYLWCAAWSTLLGDGLVAVRAASWIFAGLGVCAGLLVVSRATASRILLLVAGALLVMWMSPPWKLFESGLAMCAVYVLTLLFERPSGARRLALGVVVGLTAFFGRNLGVYVGLGALLATALLVARARQPLLRSLLDLFAGTCLGYAPMLLLIAFAPGFGGAFVESILFYTRQGALNAELPWPWPWRFDYARLSFGSAAAAFATGSLFLALPAFYALAAWIVLRRRAEDLARIAPIAAAVCVGATWFHHASVRSDLPHLAQSIHPFLIGLLTLSLAAAPARAVRARAAAWSLLALASIAAIGSSLPFVRRLAAPAGNEHVVVRVGLEDLVLAPGEARTVRGLLDLVARHVPAGEPLWVSAQLLGLYPMLGLRAPTWDIYPAWQADEAEQQRMLRELADVRWALLELRPIGGDPRMRLEVSHPAVWSWLQREFVRVPVAGAPETLVLLRRRG